jgi:hypothetical protein
LLAVVVVFILLVMVEWAVAVLVDLEQPQVLL